LAMGSLLARQWLRNMFFGPVNTTYTREDLSQYCRKC
jgi:hypothetical protein